MWGFYPAGSWFQNDPFLSAGNLAGKYVYVSSGSGVGSKYDSSVNPTSGNFDPVKFAQMIPLEVAASTSSQLYVGRVALVPGVKLTTRITPGRCALVGLLVEHLQGVVGQDLPPGVLLSRVNGLATP